MRQGCVLRTTSGRDARPTHLFIILREPKAHTRLTWKVFGGTGILPVRAHRLESLCHHCQITIVRFTHLRRGLAAGTEARPTDFSCFTGGSQAHKQLGRPKQRADRQVRPYGLSF